MYAVAWSVPTIDIVYARSIEKDVANRFLALDARPEIDYEGLLPPYICAVVSPAEALHVEGRIYPWRRYQSGTVPAVGAGAHPCGICSARPNAANLFASGKVSGCWHLPRALCHFRWP